MDEDDPLVAELDAMTDEQVLARCEAARMWQEVDAAVGLINSTASRGHLSELNMVAFLGIFHPDMDDDTRLSLIQEARLNDVHDRRSGRA